MSVTIVVAMGANRVIGAAGGLPWHLPEDLAHFKRVTLGHALVMGRATYDSIGRPLPKRHTVVVTRDRDWAAEGVHVAHDVTAAVETARALDEEVFVVGGAQIYAAALDAGLVDEMIVTRVHDAPEGDTVFPSVDWETWAEAGTVPGDGFDIVTYQRA